MLTILTAPTHQPEKEYAFHVLLNEMLGVPHRIEYQVSAKHTLRVSDGSELTFSDNFPLLGHPATFPLTPAATDPFASAFFLLTRLEETDLSVERDVHGRFPAHQSKSWHGGFLHRPLVNEWAEELWTALLRLGWKGEKKRRTFKLCISCDVDHPRLWWYGADRIKTLAGALIKRGDYKEASYWFKNHLFGTKDPYDVFEEWFDLFEANGITAQFNFMGERPKSSDCWYPLRHPFVLRLMDFIAAKGHRIGFHPSYEAYADEAAFQSELLSLRDVSPLPITSGRQHYLRFSNPQTWRFWESAGLLEDSTLGYAEAEGFRCGICHDYPVFDVERREMLRLREKPLLAMDVGLASYRGYAPGQALEHLISLRSSVEKYGGDFTLLWHNSSWNTPFWENWKDVLRVISGEGTPFFGMETNAKKP